jgi:propionyl-CoA carboxylase alpha chain/3-methylcrotonyl-CoA carboxylase alpha subunit/acetyl-CoA/propionyl-CoA carboxylase biotin carboxyl carrier protein
MVTGIDLVEEQIRIAAGEALSFSQEDIRFSGAAIECRVCAEDPDENFRPAVGELLLVRPPQGPGIRVDSGIEGGQTVTTAFDPMLSKIIVHGRDRDEAIARARQALSENVILGCTTNAAFLERILAHPDFRSGKVETGFIPAHAAELATPSIAPEERGAILAVAALSNRDFMERVDAVPEPYASMGAWRN